MIKKHIFTKDFHELSGALHLHSKYSYDGNVSLKKIIRIAKKFSVDFITINDHFSNQARTDSAVVREKDLHIVVGSEINDPELNNHLLVYDSDEIIKNKKADEYVKKYSNEKAITFIAHPNEIRSSKKYRKYTWNSQEMLPFVNGIEIWNFLSSWLGILNPHINGLLLILFPNIAIRKPLNKNLQMWDEMNTNGQKASAIGSLDCHEHKIKFYKFNLTVLKFRQLMGSIRTNILINSDKDINQNTILNALKNGNSYIINYKVGQPYGFYAGIADSNGNGTIFGESVNFKDKLRYYFRLPSIAKIKLFCDGKLIENKTDEKGFFDINKKGNYRLEISKLGRGWIYTNNIYVI